MEQNKEIRFLIYFVIVAVIFCVAYFGIYKIALTKIQENRSELLALEQSLKEKEETLEEFNKVGADYKQNRGKLTKIDQLVLEKSEDKLFVLINLDIIAAKSGIAIEGFSFEEVENSESGLGVLPVNVNIKGNYLGLKKFLDGIALSLPLMEVETMTLAPDSENPKIYHSSLKIAIYTKSVPESATQTAQPGEEEQIEEGQNQRTETSQ